MNSDNDSSTPMAVVRYMFCCCGGGGEGGGGTNEHLDDEKGEREIESAGKGLEGRV